MGEPTSCCRSDGGYCDRCDLLLGLEGLRVVAVDRDDGGALTVTVESAPGVMAAVLAASSRSGTAASTSTWSTRRRWVARCGSAGASGAGSAPSPRVR